MKSYFNSQILTTGLAIFSMFFGAGNLMFPLRVGLYAGDQTLWAIMGFCITAVLLPLIGLVALILYEGDYFAFFYRLGKIPGFLLIFFCIGVCFLLIAMPRIVTLSYTMAIPFVPGLPLWAFSIIFLGLVFLATYKESAIVDILGYVISPLLLISLIIIIIKGYLSASVVTRIDQTAFAMFWENLIYGYQTLDLLAGIFFSAIIMTLLKQKAGSREKASTKKLASISFFSGLIGLTLLALVYGGLSFLGAYFGHGLEHINEGELFSFISLTILGAHGGALIAFAVLMACYSTIIALAAVNAEFLRYQIFQKKISYKTALILGLVIVFFPSNLGLNSILYISRPIITIVYPSLIVLTVCNIAHKLFNIHAVKLPVALTLLISLGAYIYL